MVACDAEFNIFTNEITFNSIITTKQTHSKPLLHSKCIRYMWTSHDMCMKEKDVCHWNFFTDIDWAVHCETVASYLKFDPFQFEC